MIMVREYKYGSGSNLLTVIKDAVIYESSMMLRVTIFITQAILLIAIFLVLIGMMPTGNKL